MLHYDFSISCIQTMWRFNILFYSSDRVMAMTFIILEGFQQTAHREISYTWYWDFYLKTCGFQLGGGGACL